MKVNLRLYRTVSVPTDHLKGAAGLEAGEPNDSSDQAVKKAFGPHFAPGFKIFWGPPTAKRTTVGIEAMSFDIVEPGVAQAGVVACDPVRPETIQRMDGALQSELRRMGIFVTEIDDHEWRAWYEIKGSRMGMAPIPNDPGPGPVPGRMG